MGYISFKEYHKARLNGEIKGAMEDYSFLIDVRKPEEVANTVKKILQITEDKPRECRRIQYTVRACKFPEGYVFFNPYENLDGYLSTKHEVLTAEKAGKQVDGCVHIKDNFFFNLPALQTAAHRNRDNRWGLLYLKLISMLKGNLQKAGCYQTTGDNVVIWGTQGECTTLGYSVLTAHYVWGASEQDNFESGKWFTIQRKPIVTKGKTVGIFVPFQCNVRYVTHRGIIPFNVNADSHYGDILMFYADDNGAPVFTAPLPPVNNAVFSTTFNQSVGGWGKTGFIQQGNTDKCCDAAYLNGFKL